MPVHTISADYARYQATIEALEVAYAYDPAGAEADIAAEMLALGAVLEGGKWHYDGEPVTLIALIRLEDERRQIGDYVADQLEAIGFAVERQYKISAEASPCWLRGDPGRGLLPRLHRRLGRHPASAATRPATLASSTRLSAYPSRCGRPTSPRPLSLRWPRSSGVTTLRPWPNGTRCSSRRWAWP